MSTQTEHSIWSPHEVDSLENIDKEIQLVSTSTESHSVSNQNKENGSLDNVTLDCNKHPVARQSSNNFKSTYSKTHNHIKENNVKLYSSCDDLSLWRYESKSGFCGSQSKGSAINHSNTFVNLKPIKKASTHKYDHVQSKIKHSFSNSTPKMKVAPMKSKTSSETKDCSDKEDYLEEINKQLTKELDEKNAILSLLQENYEHLLFKYAEAQNRIDELRFKFMTDKTDSRNADFQMKHNVIDNQISSHFPCNEDYPSKADIKCQKAVVAPFIKVNEPEESLHPPPSRPSSLPLDNNLKYVERDLLKATTPTDSEGLSSIITSMSGHSKILNSLDEEQQINKKSNFLKYQRNNFILQENITVSDPFDKVKNWQNSLPPLEQIETPETTLYNVFTNSGDSYDSPGLNHKDVSSSKIPKDFTFSDESCPPSWREDPRLGFCRNDSERSKTQRSKISPRALSLPSNYPKQSKVSQVYLKETPHSLNVDGSEHFHEVNFRPKEKGPTSENYLPSSCIIQRRKKRPPLLRCSSLPAYNHDSIKSGNFKNGIYIPPLDLGNMTLSDDESYCQQDYYLNKSNAVTSSSFITSQGVSIDRSIQTPQSFSSCKATISEENSTSRVPRPTVNKSTSITPERSRAMDLFRIPNQDRSKLDVPKRKTPTSARTKECSECCSDKPVNRCNVCGESFLENRWFFRNRSNSCESITDVPKKETPARRPKPPFTRSVSFGSETNTPKYCSHEKETPRDYISGLSQESLENFDIYASNLKARSQVVIKALAAHVNNS